MAYISTQKVAEIRAKLKQEFPEIKFSIRKRSGNLALEVSILKAPYDFFPDWAKAKEKTFIQVNKYNTQGYPNLPILQRIMDICNEGNWNNSIAQIDYFDVGWYVDLNIGRWDREFERTPMPKNQSVRTTVFTGVPQCL